ncbi:hypothetical protein [Bacillus thuringiensis]|uniref:hypothetical protein n=1 Tax=Bacillus thuringiensis TaxID=1428 RepID=UPI0021003880|nr:hypothetical protein [Bacillus thuringiensis]
MCTRLVGACSTRRIHLSGGFFCKEELLFFERVVQVGNNRSLPVPIKNLLGVLP